MKLIIAGLALLVGMAGAGYCQGRAPDQTGGPVHPGTALLDSMGIVAGAPDARPADKAQSDTATTVTLAQPAKPTSKSQ